MAKQVEYHDFVTPDGTCVRVAVLDHNAIRVTVRRRRTAVTWHAASHNPSDDSITVNTPTSGVP
jgi:hypothetical protein